MRQRAIWQRQLFEDNDAFQLPPLPQEVRQELSRLLVQWMQDLVKAISEEVGDEQD